MSKRAETALRKSIKHWERNYTAKGRYYRRDKMTWLNAKKNPPALDCSPGNKIRTGRPGLPGHGYPNWPVHPVAFMDGFNTWKPWPPCTPIFAPNNIEIEYRRWEELPYYVISWDNDTLFCRAILLSNGRDYYCE